MRLNIKELDEQVIFLNEQAVRLDRIGEKPGNQWARRQAEVMRAIAKTLTEVRREQQMTTMSGRRIE